MTERNSNNSNRPSGIDARSLTLPVITIVSIIGFVMWVTYIGTSELAAGRSRLVGIENTLIVLNEKIKALHSDDTRKQYLTANDITVFCLRAQVLNKDWRCPSINHTYDNLNRLNHNEVLREIERLNRKDGETSPLDKDYSPPQ